MAGAEVGIQRRRATQGAMRASRKFATILKATGEVSAVAVKDDCKPPRVANPDLYDVIPVPLNVAIGMILRDGVFYEKRMEPGSWTQAEHEVARLA